MQFQILGETSAIETFATGSGIPELARLRRVCRRLRTSVFQQGGQRHQITESERTPCVCASDRGLGRKEFKIKHLL
jgi:hypothetical protein